MTALAAVIGLAGGTLEKETDMEKVKSAVAHVAAAASEEEEADRLLTLRHELRVADVPIRVEFTQPDGTLEDFAATVAPEIAGPLVVTIYFGADPWVSAPIDAREPENFRVLYQE